MQPIVNFGEACTKCMNAGTHQWYLRLDSDERMSPESIEEIRRIVSEPAPPFRVYKTPRIYVWQGKLIDDAITYPNLHIRFFRRDAVDKWTKVSHEKIVVREGEPIGIMKGAMLVPLPDSYGALEATRWRRALEWDKLHFAHYTFGQWIHAVLHSTASILIFSVRLIRVYLFSRGNKLPISYELWRFKYLVVTTWNCTKVVWAKYLRPPSSIANPK
jgi:hypothetical protein